MALHLCKFCPAQSLMLLQPSRSFIWLIVHFGIPSSASASCMCIPAAHVSAFAVVAHKSMRDSYLLSTRAFVASTVAMLCNMLLQSSCICTCRHKDLSTLLLRVQRSINLSPQQKKELLAGRHYYLSKMSEVLRQRESLLNTLEVPTACPLTLACSMQQN